ncbi:MAG: EAL domain-containing protein [Kiritimatiellae bacterium]|nr:EAL domain-containing protein [Kiritimatiellia bacterium]
MTLYRQLVIFTVLLFLILFTGTWFAKLESTRSFLTNQLESHAQDTASSLGLAVSQYPDDMVSVETIINAIFDRGYYETIRFIDPNGKILLERNLKVVIEGVPSWFIKLVPLKVPEANAYVTAGWRQAGTIYVKSHAGYAYNSLWQDIKHTTLLFALCGIFILIAGGFGLRMLLRPLVLVEQQADALCRKEYEIQTKIPRTRELRRIVFVMNRMTEKVKEMFSEQVIQAEGLRQRAYNDSLTGIGNRRYFESQVTACLDNKDSDMKGILLLIRINGLEILNKQRGFLVADELLKRVAALMQEIAAKLAGSVLARLSGSDFVLFLPDYPPSEAARLSGEVANTLSSLAAADITATENVSNVGTCAYDRSVTLGQLLAEADLALAAATQTGANAWHVRTVMESAGKAPFGQQQWKEALEKVLKDRRIVLYSQPVVKAADRNIILHQEIFSRIILEGSEIINASVFIPIAERLKLISALDRLIIEEVMKLDRKELGADDIAVNLSPSSLQDESFVQWIQNTLVNLPENAPKIIFEFGEFGAVQNENILKSFTAVIRACGHKLGLDHYGQSCGNLKYLQSLRPDYVKIDRAYTGELKDEDSDSRFFISSICSVAHSIDVIVIAEGVETEKQWQLLRELNIDAIQGYIIDSSKPIKKG